MLKILKRKSYKKKYDELLTTMSKVLVRDQKLKEENEFFRKEIRKLTLERNMWRDGLYK